jgi:GT2 family glycosyltransferase
MKLLIGIPTINRADLLNGALVKYHECYPNTDILVVDNGQQNIDTQNPKLRVFTQTSNLGVAASWNLITRTAFNEGFSLALILNDDIELVRHEHELYADIEKHPDNVFLVQLGTWCSFVVSKKVYDEVGPFDEQFFPAYFEDNDYSMRIKCNPNIGIDWEQGLCPTLYRNSMTIQRDTRLNQNFINNQNKYVAKWGGLPNQETYTTPYGK